MHAETTPRTQAYVTVLVLVPVPFSVVVLPKGPDTIQKTVTKQLYSDGTPAFCELELSLMTLQSCDLDPALTPGTNLSQPSGLPSSAHFHSGV